MPVFTQRAAIAALNEGEAFLAGQIERCRRSRDILCHGLSATGRVRFFEPEAAFYLFCAVEGFPEFARACAPSDRRSGNRRRARRGVRPRRRGSFAPVLRPRPGADRGGDTADGAVARRLRTDGCGRSTSGLRRSSAGLRIRCSFPDRAKYQRIYQGTSQFRSANARKSGCCARKPFRISRPSM